MEDICECEYTTRMREIEASLDDRCKHGNCDFGTSMVCCQSSWIIRLIAAFIQKRLRGSNDDVNVDNAHRVESCLMWLK
jgi:hypothetical protein